MPKRLATKPAEPQIASVAPIPADRPGWLHESFEGQLAVDVYQTPTDVVIKSTIAGVRAEDLDISINSDMVTIRGVREQNDVVDQQDYFYQECYWGGFSRSIILPVDVHAERAKASLRNGVLTVTIPKVQKARVQVVRVKEEGDT